MTEKRDETIKGQMIYNGKPMREWLSREDASSPTAALESIMLTALIDATERRNIMRCDIPNGFMQALMPEVKAGDERVMMKITGVLVGMLVELNPQLYMDLMRSMKKEEMYSRGQSTTKSHLRNVRGCLTMSQEILKQIRRGRIQV
jgi:hypothetical protein